MKTLLSATLLFALLFALTTGCDEPVKQAPAPTSDSIRAVDEADDTPENKTPPVDTVATPQPVDEEPAAEPETQVNPNTDGAATEPKSRKFQFFYDVAVSDLAPGTKARVWIPIAQSGPHQSVEIGEVKLPAEYDETTEEKLGNKFIYFEGTANDEGEIPISITYTIARDEVLASNAQEVDDKAKDYFLASDALVPVDGSLTKRVFGDQVPQGGPLEKARQMYEAVENRMQYGKPADKAWGRGDANYACDEKVGNCTDFHSLFIALSRDQHMPAKFEIGFPIPNDSSEGEVSGYHCWAYFSNGQKWLPVDISEADKHPELKEYYFTRLTPDRVTFTEGRDLQLKPSPAAEKVNFVVYPYVEVDGKEHANIRKSFRFKEIK